MNYRSAVTLQKQDDIIIASISSELDDSQASHFQEALLAKAMNENIHGVVIDISALDSVDLFLARLIVETAKMAGIMDVHTVVVGIKPAVAITLTEMGIRLSGVSTASTLDAGLAVIRRKRVDQV